MNLDYKARKKKDYKFLFNESVELLSCMIRKFQDQKNFDFDECHADFLDCSTSSQCDDLLKEVK